MIFIKNIFKDYLLNIVKYVFILSILCFVALNY